MGENIGHIRFGRIQRRQEEYKTQLMVQAVEKMVGKLFPSDTLKELVAGPTELDLVRSGLDDTMGLGYQVISDNRIPDMGIAAMMITLEGMIGFYRSLGI